MAHSQGLPRSQCGQAGGKPGDHRQGCIQDLDAGTAVSVPTPLKLLRTTPQFSSMKETRSKHPSVPETKQTFVLAQPQRCLAGAHTAFLCKFILSKNIAVWNPKIGRGYCFKLLNTIITHKKVNNSFISTIIQSVFKFQNVL